MMNSINDLELGEDIFNIWFSHLEDKERKRQHWVKGMRHYAFKNHFVLA